ncbi:hypothetical protein BT93_L4117 [Corymbia citriodora subsp. variegata]|uniref:Uncharacterized protein n=1 Tax=Corymbia citriodora subsp. variegata TaxID=360336 RepID=A0A8T0CX99_CORYI|nr:hypothetical protein BT93_L4117 [Corymbia citriodora subsp. variegata]
MLSCALALGNETRRTIYSSHITSHPNFRAEPTTDPSQYGTNTAKATSLRQIQCYFAQLII